MLALLPIELAKHFYSENLVVNNRQVNSGMRKTKMQLVHNSIPARSKIITRGKMKRAN